MSHRFGSSSSKKLATCDPLLVAVCQRALELSPYDFTIVHGWRGEDIQNALFDSQASRRRWPESKHNSMKDGRANSEAVDFAPWINGAIPWDDTHIFAIIAGSFHAAAKEKNAVIRYGGDWDTDGSTLDQTLMDWGHVEVIL